MDDIANLTDVSGDHHPDAIGPQFSRHLVEDLGRRHIDIWDRLRVNDDCVNVGAFLYEFAKIFSPYLDLNFLTISSTPITVYYWFTSRRCFV